MLAAWWKEGSVEAGEVGEVGSGQIQVLCEWEDAAADVGDEGEDEDAAAAADRGNGHCNVLSKGVKWCD